MTSTTRLAKEPGTRWTRQLAADESSGEGAVRWRKGEIRIAGAARVEACAESLDLGRVERSGALAD